MSVNSLPNAPKKSGTTKWDHGNSPFGLNIEARIRHFRWLIAASNRFSWLLGKHFPNVLPQCFVVGFPKSGTTWVCQLLGDCLNLPFPELSLFPIGCPAIAHGHEAPKGRYHRGAYVMRDGRDAMISLYFHWARAVPEGDRPRLNRFQRCMFPGLTNKANVRENLPAFLEQQMVRPVATKGHNWGQHVQRFFDSGESNLVLMKYESLLSDPISELRHAIAEIMGEEPDERILEFAVEKHSFARQSGRKRGEEDKKSFLRKAQAGDWRNYFTREAAEVFDRYCGEQLIAAGYEADRNWIDDLGSTTERTMDHAA